MRVVSASQRRALPVVVAGCAGRLVNAEIHFDVDFHRHGFALECGWLEAILPHRLDCLFVQPHAQVAHHLNPLRIALSVHDQRDDADTLVLCPAGLIRKLWVWREY